MRKHSQALYESYEDLIPKIWNNENTNKPIWFEMNNFLRKIGGDVIDYIFCILAIWAVLDYSAHGGVSRDTIQAAFALVALYAFVVTRRFHYLHNQYKQKFKEMQGDYERRTRELLALEKRIEEMENRKYHEPDLGS